MINKLLTYLLTLSSVHHNNKSSLKMEIKIGTLNLCQGIKNKRNEVERMLLENNIDILCLQETEVEENYDSGILNLNNYDLELEVNSVKSRAGI